MIQGMAFNDELICQQFARIISGQEGLAGGKCVATIIRDEIQATILGKRFRVTSSFSFESRDNKTVSGVVKDILTHSETHTYGIKVRLQDGQIGRVQSVN
ncbi:hypothetical protein COJ45_30155 [Bacillus cereus]|nr:hypothetical protein COJ45_30155 [Bacillus cereus]